MAPHPAAGRWSSREPYSGGRATACHVKDNKEPSPTPSVDGKVSATLSSFRRSESGSDIGSSRRKARLGTLETIRGCAHREIVQNSQLARGTPAASGKISTQMSDVTLLENNFPMIHVKF
jgi:hypothetical protein